ncbi:uncharacterized protein OCT59_026162 [Rhizophagus irregularis]|uniref:Uncharacterized protein n=2 Tax=Rhizophagus irregularis TaxID=588596 RepID=A0A015LYT9_RHIIW|nr:hypothetical protein GLOIN_2v1566407 [Rhizophagus irregularis DAOM 181602=DAOM 197198]EXX59833.1 hypothetical protein RirG_185480 [Rhizophagus irregularis DAOM 197198w]UZO05823.1 hypothetical protein OCT59_026162 [Rhizophagus irregularis]POG75410.1 hypothetical protein GLOIN_2v1566407 [Rhizophagus irregularis DAOM 181602=DAOM 197198]CAG8721331.1 10531_t:CDS:2 [Rhizophagus irregularis]GBC17259.1 hypothetical protein GLOIN_2v1566407 [Rhizophagus irregularis DAOM 181602=DAOM 197198]|eukprot:XP_025182276.1 hypothetical protein GLOIN_2v1566407 [Rhizophagus irregularis DAOM 181602=DAOM 197198]
MGKISDRPSTISKESSPTLSSKNSKEISSLQITSPSKNNNEYEQEKYSPTKHLSNIFLTLSNFLIILVITILLSKNYNVSSYDQICLINITSPNELYYQDKTLQNVTWTIEECPDVSLDSTVTIYIIAKSSGNFVVNTTAKYGDKHIKFYINNWSYEDSFIVSIWSNHVFGVSNDLFRIYHPTKTIT